MSSNLQTNVPLVNTPFVDGAGNITEPWFLFLVQLFRRTGGTSGGGSTSLTLADVIALDQTFPPLSVSQESALAQMATMAPLVLSDAPVSEMVFPNVPSDVLDQTFSSGTDFTPGTTTSLTLQTSFTSAARLWIFFDAAFQGDDQYTLSGTTLTFTSAIPVGVNKVYVKGLM